MTAQIGFGCASLGSRISRRAGLAALEHAYEKGVRWFDVAPSYGDGQAETILGEFLRGRRNGLSLCTKVGILPPAASLPKQLLRPMLRTALAAAPGLRQVVRRRRPAAVKPPLDAAKIMPSLDASLSRLGTDYVDVLALHEATAAEVIREDILHALEAVLASGKARRISIASSAHSALAGLSASAVYGAVQLANNPFEPMLSKISSDLPHDRSITTITHTVFGASGMIERLALRIREDETLASVLRDAGYNGSARDQALDFLPDYAFATNDRGVVLLSMFGAGHLEANLARLAKTPDRTKVLAIATNISADAIS